jgi:hypothetical protein
MKTAAVLGVNVLILALGAGLLPRLRLAHTWRQLLGRLPLAYAVGLAATGILAADLAVVAVPVGWVALSVLTAASLAAGLWRLPLGEWRRPKIALTALPAYAVLAVTAAFVVPAFRLATVKPLYAIDGFGIWGLRAHALYLFGHPIPAVFANPAYQALQHPLLLPALEALDARAMGTFDGTLVQIQLVGFAVAFVGGAWGLLRDRVPPLLLAAVLLAVITTPTFIYQLQSNYADVPLALFIALGVATLALWLRRGGEGLLPAAALFLGAAALTKNEGEMFSLTAFAAAAFVAQRAQLRSLALAALFVIAVDLPWRIWLWAHHVKIAEYSLSNLFSPSYLYDRRGRVGPSAHELLRQLLRFEAWSYVLPLVLLGLAGALLVRRYRPAAFAGLWLLLSFAGLVAIYWISTNKVGSHLADSSDRTIDSLVFGGALLVPVLLSTE